MPSGSWARRPGLRGKVLGLQSVAYGRGETSLGCLRAPFLWTRSVDVGEPGVLITSFERRVLAHLLIGASAERRRPDNASADSCAIYFAGDSGLVAGIFGGGSGVCLPSRRVQCQFAQLPDTWRATKAGHQKKTSRRPFLIFPLFIWYLCTRATGRRHSFSPPSVGVSRVIIYSTLSFWGRPVGRTGRKSVCYLGLLNF